MLIGYARVSKGNGDQILDLQLDALTAAGVEAAHVYTDHASGKRDDRPGLAAALKAARRGDVLVVWKLDRLGRDLRHLVTVADDLSSRGVGLRVLSGAPIDTTTPAGRLTFQLFAALAEFERELTRERVKAGLEAARRRGRLGGRPRALSAAKVRIAAAAMKDQTTSAKRIAEEMGVSTTTLYRYVTPEGDIRK